MNKSTDEAANKDVVLCTCSMPADLPLFRLLAQSVDERVDPAIRHLVIVPGAHLDAFKPFQTSRREIVAQEDILPIRIFKLPAVTRLLAPVVPTLRRPLYVDGRLRVVRGWIVQQMLKIEISQRVPERAIVHVDSDVCFIRSFSPHNAFVGDKPMLFCVRNDPNIRSLTDWTVRSAEILGLDPRLVSTNIFIENCVVWSPVVVREMVKSIENHHGIMMHDILVKMRTFSEYVLYGVFATHTQAAGHVREHPWPLCKTIWNSADQADIDSVVAKMRPDHRAVAIQSTEALPAEQRAVLYDRVARLLAGQGKHVT